MLEIDDDERIPFELDLQPVAKISCCKHEPLLPSARRRNRFREIGDSLPPRSGDPYHVLEPHPSTSGKVDPRLHGDHHPLGKPVLRPVRERGALVDVQAYSMAGRMNKIL
jgi:hypothetical protein